MMLKFQSNWSARRGVTDKTGGSDPWDAELAELGKIPVPEIKKAEAWEARLLEETGTPPSMVAVEGCELALGIERAGTRLAAKASFTAWTTVARKAGDGWSCWTATDGPGGLAARSAITEAQYGSAETAMDTASRAADWLLWVERDDIIKY